MAYWKYGVAILLAFVLSAAQGPVVIPALHKLKFGQSILDIGPSWHKKKQGTPTMGGLMFIGAAVLSTVLCAALGLIPGGDMRMWYVLLMSVAFGAIGFLDDYIKVVKKRNLGLSAKQKSFLQVLVAIAFLASMQIAGYLSTELWIPFANVRIDLGIVYYLFAVITIVGFVNGVNLTDGVDGLATSVTIPVTVFFAVAAALRGAFGISIYALAVAGALAGFLLYNFNPAKVFMGDTGSLFLGGVVTGLGFVLDMPALIFIAGLIYLIEAASVMLQVGYFKLTHGKRLFKMSPLHHHFEMCGWNEIRITLSFAAFTVLMCAVAALSLR